MADNDPNQNNQGNNQGNDGNNANQGGDNSQGNGGNQNKGNGAGQGNQGNANQNQNNGGNQGGDDFKVKFGESTKENQRLMQVLKDAGIDPKTGKKAEGNGDGGNNQQNQGGAADQQFFTDAELEAAFPSFATMSESEKQVARNMASFPKLARQVAEIHDKLTFTEQLEVLKADPANKIIADNEKEFKAYAYQDGNLKLPIEVLADAFIGKKLREGGNNNGGGNNQQNQGNNRQGMENGSGGQGQGSGTTQEMTAAEARELRTKDPRKYQQLVREKKLKIVSGN